MCQPRLPTNDSIRQKPWLITWVLARQSRPTILQLHFCQVRNVKHWPSILLRDRGGQCGVRTLKAWRESRCLCPSPRKFGSHTSQLLSAAGWLCPCGPARRRSFLRDNKSSLFSTEQSEREDGYALFPITEIIIIGIIWIILFLRWVVLCSTFVRFYCRAFVCVCVCVDEPTVAAFVEEVITVSRKR